MRKLPMPRLLPVTITMLTLLLVVKCGLLLQAVVTHGQRPESMMVAAANAAGAEKEHAKPAAANPAAPATPAEPPRTESAKSSTTEGPPPVSESEKAILQGLRQRRKELDERDKSVTVRESVLAAAEKKLTVRVAELETLEKKLEGLDAAQKQKEDAGWQGMVKLYEAMKPKEAATIFNELSMPVLLQVLDRMKDAKAAAVMAAMSLDKARDVTAELAQMRTGQDPSVGMPGSGLKLNPIGG